ncbi:MAG: hypothetical protein ACI9VR_003842 [Cognaticolwellia sp.]
MGSGSCIDFKVVMTHSRPSLLVLLSAGLALGVMSCVSQQDPPIISGVSPDRIYVADTTPIRLKGARFFPAVQVDVSRDGSAVNEGFELSFVHRDTGHRVDLDAVAWDSFDQLSSVWPANEPTGDYDLELTSPDGQETVLEFALSVSDSRASSIVVTSDGNSFVVGDEVRFDLSLVDAQGQAVVEEGRVPITLHVEGSEVADLIVSESQGLDELLQVSDRDWVTSLSPSGDNWFRVGSLAPGLLTLVVSDDGEGLEDGERTVVFEEGSLASLEIEIPGEGFASIAGEAFPVILTPRDAQGNIVNDQEIALALSDRCDGRVSPDYVTLSGEQTVMVSFFRATPAAGDCSETRLLVGGSGGNASEPFVVRAADASQLVLTLDQEAQLVGTAAGERLDVRIEARDSYSNLVIDFDLPLGFTSRTTGGELEGASVEPRLEEVWVSGVSLWKWTPFTAGQAVLEATGGGLSTLSESVTISPGAATELDGDVDTSLVQAGNLFIVKVGLSDPYGNEVAFEPTLDTLVVQDDLGAEVSCSYSGGDAVRSDFDCVATSVNTGTSLNLQLEPVGLSTLTDSLVIENGPAAVAVWSVPSSAVAGSSFDAQVEVSDAYGNPFTVGGRTLSISDDSGGLTPGTLTLDAAGVGGGGLILTASGTRTLSADSSGSSIGTGQIEVEADEAVALELEWDLPWVWLAESETARVRGIDQYGNQVGSYSETVTLSSEQGLFATQTTSSFSAGSADVEFIWDSVGLQDRVLLSSSSGLSGSSGTLDAVESCSGGPTAVLSLGGVTQDAVSCLSSGVASVTADLSGSTAGSTAIAALHLDDGVGVASRGPSTSRALSSTSSGHWLVELLVVDAAGCAEESQVLWYTAENGVPAGPVTVSAADAARTAGGSSAQADSALTVSASDCSGASLSSGSLLIRADMGSLSGATVGTQGLELDLATGGVSWSASAVEQNGTAIVHVGLADGSAYGRTTLDIEGESISPQLAWTDPRGATSETLSEIQVAFNEDILGSTVDDSVTLSGPDGEIGWTSSVAGSLLTLTLDQSLDASSGSFQLELSSSLTDTQGNALSGDWSGSAADYSGLFGAVTDSGILVSSCTLDTPTFQPDGDSGTGVLADSVTLSAVASSTPDYWILQVYSANGAMVFTQTQTAGSTSGSLSWSGLDKDGVVLSPGLYSLHASTMDGNDNLSDSCVQYLSLQQSLVPPSE